MKKPNLQKFQYDSKLAWLLLVPPVALYLDFVLGLIGRSILADILQLVVIVSIVYLYVVQVKYIKKGPTPKKFKWQNLLFIIALVTPMIAMFTGDIMGGLAYNTPSNYGTDVGFGLAIGAGVTLLSMYVCAIGNQFYIMTHGKNKALRIIGVICYPIGYLLVAGVSYLAYGIVYTLHDPSTE